MSDFKCGDRVKIVSVSGDDDFTGYVGRVGTYFKYDEMCDFGEHPYGVMFDDNDWVYCAEHEIALVDVKVIEGKVTYGTIASRNIFTVGGVWLENAMEEFDGKSVRITIETLPQDG